MRARTSIFWLLPIVGAVVYADERIKAYGLAHFPDESAIVDPGIVSLAIHKNWGIAFDIPFKMPLIIAVSLLIGTALVIVAIRNVRAKPEITMSALTIVIGAAGNLYDRLAYGFTVDYLILFRRSAINISDVVIVAGVIALLHASRVRGNHGHGTESLVHDTGDTDKTIDKSIPS